MSVALVANVVGYSAGLSKAAAETKAFSREVEGAQAKAAETGGWMSASTMIHGVELAAVLAGAALFKIGEDFGAAFRTLRQETGASGPALAGLEGSLKRVYAARPESLKAVTDTIVELHRQLGLAGPALESVAIAELRLASITKSDLSSNLTATTALFNNFGIAAGDQVNRLNELYRVHEHTGIGIADLAQQMITLGPITRTLGLNFDQTAALVGSLSKSGIDATRMTQGLTHVLKEAAKAGQDGGTYLRKVFDEIKAAPGPTEAASVAFANFGGRAGWLVDIIRSGKLDFQSFTAALTGGSDTIAKSAIETASWSGKVKIALHDLEVQLQPLGSKLFEGLTAGAATALPAVQKAIASFGAGALQVFHELAPAGRDLVSAFRDLGPILHSAAVAGEPVVKLFGALALGATIGTIRVLSAGLSDLAGFLAHNEIAVRLLTTALLSLAAVRVLSFIADLGGAGLMVFNNLRLAVTELGTSISGGLLTRLALLRDGLMLVASGEVEGGLARLYTAFNGLGRVISTVGVAALIWDLQALTQAEAAGKREADAFSDSLKKLTGASPTNPVGLQAYIKGLSEQIKGYSHAADSSYTSTQGWLNGLKGAGQFLSGGLLGRSVDENRSKVEEWRKQVAQAKGELAKLDEVLPQLQYKLGGMARSDVLSWLDKLHIDPSKTGLSDVVGQIRDASNAAIGGTPTTDALAQSYSTLSDMTKSSTDRLTAWKGVLDSIIGIQTDAFSAQTKFAESIDKLTSSFTTNGATLDEWTAKGQANRTALADAAKGAIDYASSIAKSTGNTQAGVDALKTYRAKLIDVLQQAHITGGALDLLLRQLGLADDQVTIAINSAQVDGATALGKQLNQQLDAAAHPRAIAFNTDLLKGMPKFIQDSFPPVTVTLDPAKIPGQVGYLQQFVANSQSFMPIGGDTKGGRTDVLDYMDWVNLQRAQALINGNTNPGHLDIDAYRAWVQSQGAAVNVTADMSAAYAQVAAFKAAAQAAGATINHLYGGNSRWGNVTAYASGGVSPAFITRRELMKFGEPETGGEAYIPRLGNPLRSRAILATAAAWYGLQLMPKTYSGVAKGWDGATIQTAGPGAATHQQTVVVSAGAVQVNVTGPVYGVDDLDAQIGSAVSAGTRRLGSDLARKLEKS